MDRPIDFRLRFEIRSGYLYAVIEAEKIDRPAALEYFAQIALKCADVRSKRLLVDRHIPATLPNGDFLKTLKDYVEMSRGLRIAFVNRHYTTHDAWSAAVSEVSRDGADFGCFQDIKSAEKWLLQGH